MRESLLRVRSTQRARQAVEFMRDRGFTHIRKTIYGHPGVLVLKVHGRLKLKLDFLETIGFRDEDVPNFICREPRVLGCSVENNLRPRIQYLEELLGAKANLVKVLKIASGFLRIKMEKQVEPKLELFKQCGILGELLSCLISACPTILTRCSVELLKTRIAYVRSMDILEGSKLFVRALCVVVSLSPQNYEKKLKHLASLGLEDKTHELVKKHPLLLAVSTNKMHENMDFLVGTVGFAPQIVWANSVLLGFSLEKRLKLRHAVFKILCLTQQSNPSLLHLFRSTEKDFNRKYVECHSEGSILKEIYFNAKDADVTTTSSSHFVLSDGDWSEGNFKTPGIYNLHLAQKILSRSLNSRKLFPE